MNKIMNISNQELLDMLETEINSIIDILAKGEQDLMYQHRTIRMLNCFRTGLADKRMALENAEKVLAPLSLSISDIR